MSLVFRPRGLSPEGEPLRFQVEAEDQSEHRRAVWEVLSSKRRGYEPQRRIYEPFLATGASLRWIELGGWRVWELLIEPMTNGDPPAGQFWVIQHKASGALLVRGASSYGLMRYQASKDNLQLQAIGEGASLGSISLLVWNFHVGKHHLSAQIGKPQWVFVLGGEGSLVYDSTGPRADRKGIDLFARTLLRVSDQGGEAGPNGDHEDAPTPGLLSGWALQIPHYSTDDWGQLHWAWTDEWHAGPKRHMVGPSTRFARFKWADEIRILDRNKKYAFDLDSVSGPEATRIARRPGWKVVLADEPGIGPVAVTLVPPGY